MRALVQGTPAIALVRIADEVGILPTLVEQRREVRQELGAGLQMRTRHPLRYVAGFRALSAGIWSADFAGLMLRR